MKSASMPVAGRSDLTVFLYAALGFVYLSAGAQIYLVELLAVVICVHAIASRGTFGIPATVVVTLLIWIFGSVLSDLANATAVGDSLKGFARAASLLILVLAIGFLVGGRPRRVLLLWGGIATSLCLGLLLVPNSYFAGEPWKFGWSQPVTLLAFLLASTWARSFGAAVALCAGVINFALGTRSLAIVCLVAALLLVLRSRRRGGSRTVRLLVVMAVGMVLIVGVVLLYDRLALAGWFGPERLARAQYQSSGDFGVFLTGRGEFFFSLRSIAESPMFGVGSYSPPSADVMDAQLSLLVAEGYSSVAQNYITGGLASFHSEILGSVAENGILALPFWLVVGMTFFRGMNMVISGYGQYNALVAYISALGMWDLFFSPFGADRKFWVAASIVTVLTLTPGKKHAESLNNHNQFQSGKVLGA